MTHKVQNFAKPGNLLNPLNLLKNMKRSYIIPFTEKVNFGADEATMKFSDLTDASNPGGPSAPERNGAQVKLTKMYI